MQSTKSRKASEEERQAAIRKQIADLQAQLLDAPREGDASSSTAKVQPRSPKRWKGERKALVPGTPSPKRRKLNDASSGRAGSLATAKPLPSFTSHLSRSLGSHSIASSSASTLRTSVKPLQPGPSNVLSKLASLTRPKDDEGKPIIVRSSGFTERPAPPQLPTEETDDLGLGGQRRDENLALVEDLELGPAEHKAPFDDPNFQYLEPNSGIRLLSRSLEHDDLQDYLRGRYYLSPSKLYSVIRLLPNKQGYDVPVQGDWVTIAVIAERGPMKYSKAPVGIGREDSEHLPEKEAKLDEIIPDVDSTVNSRVTDLRHWKGKTKQDHSGKPGGKKYINLKLIDFGCRSGSSATGGKSVIRGDALLSLLLFEADRVEEVVDDEGKKQKIYRGGSKGAFERISQLKEGAVVALLNPRVLKPFQRSGDNPHPTENILAVTPESIDSTIVIGQSRDLGMCKAVKRDGKVCGSWCDKRVSDVCDWHIQQALQSKRASRPEFSIGTGNMSTSAKRRPAYDPSRQWGLKPDPSRSQGDGATYVVSGHIISGSADTKSLFLNETIGREAQAKAARKVTAHDTERTLKKLLQRDKDGMKALAAARAFVKQPIGAKGEKKTEMTKKRKRQLEESEESNSESDEEAKMNPGSNRKSAYSAQLIRNLGFDPATKEGRKAADPNVQRKLEALAVSQSSRRDIALGPRPGKKLSSVRAPDSRPSQSTGRVHDPSSLQLPSLSDDEVDREFEAFGTTVGSRSGKLIDLDGSSDME